MNNPKAAQAVADGKAPLDYLESAVCDPSEARVMFSGAQKYGRRNFRDSTIKATTYVGALRRHVNAFASGEDIDPDSGEPHLAHIRACCAVLMSAQDAGTYDDDRGVAVTLPARALGRTYDCRETDGVCKWPETCFSIRSCSSAKGEDDLTPQYHRGVDELAEELSADAKATFCSFRGGDCETLSLCRYRGTRNAKRRA
jgi:hypothetical protein